MITDLQQLIKEYIGTKTQGKYVLNRIDRFGDFEISQESTDLFIGDTKEELEELCRQNNWEFNNPIGWNVYSISFHTIKDL